MKFVKMQGCGNDYIYIKEEELLKIPEAEWVRYVRLLCDRHFGVGADGVIVIRTLDGIAADFEMLVYNADGSRAGMCGNGILCVGRYVYEQGLTGKKDLRIASGYYQAGMALSGQCIDCAGQYGKTGVSMR